MRAGHHFGLNPASSLGPGMSPANHMHTLQRNQYSPACFRGSAIPEVSGTAFVLEEASSRYATTCELQLFQMPTRKKQAAHSERLSNPHPIAAPAPSRFEVHRSKCALLISACINLPPTYAPPPERCPNMKEATRKRQAPLPAEGPNRF